MDKKFEAVIDLEAQPLTDAVRTAINALQMLADELSRANGTLDQAAAGMDRSAAAADVVSDSVTNAGTALRAEADAAKSAAEAHDKHASAAKKNADATRLAADQNKKMREGLMVGASLLRTASQIADGSGSAKTAQALDVASAVLSAFAMRAMMGSVGTLVGIGEVGSKVVPMGQEWLTRKYTDPKKINADALGREYASDQIKKQIEGADGYNSALSVQLNLQNQLAEATLKYKQAVALDFGGDNREAIQAAKLNVDLLERSVSLAKQKTDASRKTDAESLLSQFDAIRREAIGDKSFALDLINAKSEEAKIDIIDQKIRKLRVDAKTLEGSARVAAQNGDPAEIKKMLDRAASIYSSADALELQAAEMRKSKGKGVDVPLMASMGPQVDAFWKSGLFLGGGSGGAGTVDYSRRTAAASERTARNTEQMIASLASGMPATWGEG